MRKTKPPTKKSSRPGCILCGRPPIAVGIWTPTAKYRAMLGEPPGKTRLAAYAVCRKHLGDKHATAIEDVFLADTAALRN